jgi:hypothetical protein
VAREAATDPPNHCPEEESWNMKDNTCSATYVVRQITSQEIDSLERSQSPRIKGQ